MNHDIPSPIDLRQMDDAVAWADSALPKRPARPDFFAAMASAIRQSHINKPHILELGSGPGFLAEYLLSHVSPERYSALDFSPAMHQLAQARLADKAAQVEFIERSFKVEDWTQGLANFDYVVTLQAVHELRHKRHAPALFEQIRQVLNLQGSLLVCDHYAGHHAIGGQGMQNEALYMRVEEQYTALQHAGFSQIRPLLIRQGMVLHQAR